MYGLILNNLSEYIISVYGDEKWEIIRKSAGCTQAIFGIHQVYPDVLIPKLGAKACKQLEITERAMYEGMGKYFVSFVGQFGYERVLSVLGRHFRDFINNLDNLHEYLRFSYPRMKPPSFFCEEEDESGLTLHYRSKRKGFIWYVYGQIQEVGLHFYDTEIEVELVKEEHLFDTIHVVFRLKFDNRIFKEITETEEKTKELFEPVTGNRFLEIFPFSMVFGEDLMIKTIGNSLMAVLPQVVNKKLTDMFDMIKPLIECSWKSILLHTNNIFELVTIEPITNPAEADGLNMKDNDSMSAEEDLCMHLKGQMIFIQDWDSLVFLGTPVMSDLDSLMKTGLYINDLSMHDLSRDLVLAGQQQAAELKLALDQEKTKSKQLNESMDKLEVERKRTDELLYQMIPKQIADRLRKGENSENICEYFESVTILFSDVVGFTSICSRISPMEVVSMLNGMYSLFDQLTERHKVYKVETIGDAYMVVSGAPTPNEKHAEDVCKMALDMVALIQDLKDPSTDEGLTIRVGLHSGAVAAGVVGMKMPRYCLFGETVNTASKMESSSERLKIHVTEYTKFLLNMSEWVIKDRGAITVKGKGKIKTFWLEDAKFERPDPREGLKVEIEMPQSHSSMAPSSLGSEIDGSKTPNAEREATGADNAKETSVSPAVERPADPPSKRPSLSNPPPIQVSRPDSSNVKSILRTNSNSSIHKSVESSKLFKNKVPSPSSNKVSPIGNGKLEPNGDAAGKESNMNRVTPTVILPQNGDRKGSVKSEEAVHPMKKDEDKENADNVLKEEVKKVEDELSGTVDVVHGAKCLGKRSSMCVLL